MIKSLWLKLGLESLNVQSSSTIQMQLITLLFITPLNHVYSSGYFLLLSAASPQEQSTSLHKPNCVKTVIVMEQQPTVLSVSVSDERGRQLDTKASFVLINYSSFPLFSFFFNCQLATSTLNLFVMCQRLPHLQF